MKLTLAMLLFFSFVPGAYASAYCNAGAGCWVHCLEETSCSAAIARDGRCCTQCGDSDLDFDYFLMCLDGVGDYSPRRGGSNGGDVQDPDPSQPTQPGNDIYDECVSDCIDDGFTDEYCAWACEHLLD